MIETTTQPARMRCGDRWLSLAEPQVMGILNVTPDSFSDGGQLLSGSGPRRDELLRRAEAMVAAGATLLDVGGESTRPGAAQVLPAEELERVVPAVEWLKGAFDVVVSVDTSTPEVMTAATAAGAGMLNDVRALSRPGALPAAAASGLPICLMHTQGEPATMQDSPHYGDVTQEVRDYLQERAAACLEVGIARERLLVDPGFGFGKTLAHNLELLNRLESLSELGLPLLVGMSRKSMVGKVLNKPVDQRLFGSLAAAALAVSKGAWILRVHDVAETVDVVRFCHAVRQEGRC